MWTFMARLLLELQQLWDHYGQVTPGLLVHHEKGPPRIDTPVMYG
jgi:hypothetical protein